MDEEIRLIPEPDIEIKLIRLIPEPDIEIKLLLPVRYVEDREKVTKRTGHKLLEVSRKVVVYEQNNQRQFIRPEPGTVFLLDGGPNISAVADTTEVIWHTDANGLREFLCRIEDGIPQ
jgi:hypothetical protein